MKELFTLSETIEATHKWSLLSHNIDMCSTQLLANKMADEIMKQRCINCSHHYLAWKDKIDNNAELTSQSKAALRAFIRPVFGTPEEPTSVPLNHIEGFVGQMLWFFISQEISSEEIVRIEQPGFAVTDHGGDGFVIHRCIEGNLFFRLWEMKKFVQRKDNSQTNISSTINEAYNQLKENGTEYLARLTSIGQEIDDPDLKSFYGKLIDYWIDATPEASLGVSITTSEEQIPKRCFTTFGDQFPSYAVHRRLQGMLTGIGDFELFCKMVRECIWKGL